jgi:hypothetical protein
MTANTANGPRLDLTPAGNPLPTLASPRECKDRSCASIQSGGYFVVSKQNFGQYRELSFSLWFKPLNGSTNNARIIDFGNGSIANNILLMRATSTSSLRVSVSRGAESTSFVTTGGVWVENDWKHIAWTMSPTSDGKAQHRIYVDGVLRASPVLYYPIDGDLESNYIGRSNSGGDGVFVGLIESFAVYSTALTLSQVNAGMQVSFSRKLC